MYAAWKRQQQIHWMPEEVPMGEDLKDWKRLNDRERNLLTHIFRFFTQQDVEVLDNYMDRYSAIFKPIECRMMLGAFSNMETIHVDAYSLLIETVGMPETTYNAFMDYKAMKDKSDYMASFTVDDTYEVAKTLAAFGAFTEGLQLYASFAMLMNFPRHNKMKGMGQIVSWSVRDESLHAESIIKLYHTWLAEHPELDRQRLASDLTRICYEIVAHEDAFIDLAFELGDIDGLSRDDMKAYIRYVGKIRLRQLGVDPPASWPSENPLPWLDSLLAGVEHANFFEARATEYAKAATQGEWADAYD